MALLAISLTAFIGLHLIPYFATGLRARVQKRLGVGTYKGVFALLVAFSLVGIVFGWMASEPVLAYQPPVWGIAATQGMSLVGFVLFFASQAPTNIRRLVRHPQMTGLFLWAIGHMLSNSEGRSALLFGGLAAWSIIAIYGANRRDGDWQKPDTQPFAKDVVTVLIGVTAFAGFMYFHEAIIGVSSYP